MGEEWASTARDGIVPRERSHPRDGRAAAAWLAERPGHDGWRRLWDRTAQFGRRGDGGRRLAAWTMLGPATLGLAVFAIYPALYVLALSFSKSTLGQPFKRAAGWSNYLWQIGAEAGFLPTLWRAAAVSFSAAAIELILGVTLAVLLADATRHRKLIRTALLLPLMTAPVLVGIAWKLLLAPAGGLVNGKLLAWGLAQAPVSFLGEQPWAWLSLIVADVWQWTPFVAILAFAALQQTPQDVVEAGRLDGASERAIFWFIELPIAAPALIAIFLLRLIMAFKTFDVVYILTYGGPGSSTTMSGFAIWRTALREFDVGAAAAQTVLFALAVSLAIWPVVWLHKRMEAAT